MKSDSGRGQPAGDIIQRAGKEDGGGSDGQDEAGTDDLS